MNWPIFFISFIVTYVLTKKLFKRHKKHVSPKRTELQKQSDELITVILPVIKDDR